MKILKFDAKTINKVDFLLDMLSKITYPENIYHLAKQKERFHINDDLIRTYAELNHISSSFIEPFLKYCKDGFVVNGNELEDEGFRGEEIGEEKKRREVERYKNDYIK